MGKSKAHYTNAGIKQCGTFSVNLPSAKMVQETDYCGLVLGRFADKTKLFNVFYGKLKTAPMIAECPICIECKLTNVVDFPMHDIGIGEIMSTYTKDAVLTDGIVDYSKVQPFFSS
ncbi:MAG: flavin reductase family protein [Halobacteriota archaeon]